MLTTWTVRLLMFFHPFICLEHMIHPSHEKPPHESNCNGWSLSWL